MSASDHLPEQLHYRDDGCEISPKCLECPLPACRYDMPPKRAGALLREAELRRLLAEGLTADQAAERMGVSRRTVFRLKRYAAVNAVIPLPLR
ncbi:MAG: helix-turn-helix domain-containing protein [Dehalococcoidia bacterium]